MKRFNGYTASLIIAVLAIALYFIAKDRWLDDEHKHAYRYNSKMGSVMYDK